MAGEEVVGSGDKEGFLGVFSFLFFFFLGFFCLVFVISSIPERDKQHFQGEKKNHVIRKQRRVRASLSHVSLFPTPPAHLVFLLFPRLSFCLRFGLFSVILLSPFVLPVRLPVGLTCPLRMGNRLFLNKSFL